MSETIEEERERNLRWARETVKLIQEGADRDELIDKELERLFANAVEEFKKYEGTEGYEEIMIKIKEEHRKQINGAIDEMLHEMTLYKLTVIVEKLERRVELLETNKN